MFTLMKTMDTEWRKEMLKRLQRKFIIIAALAISIVTLLIAGGINLINLINIDIQTDNILNILIDNGGAFPEYNKISSDSSSVMTPETRFSTRYFIVTTDSDYDVTSINSDHIAALSESQIKSITSEILNSKDISGYYQNYKYKVVSSNDNYTIYFLDCNSYTFNQKNLLKTSTIVAFICIASSITIIILFSKKALKPIIENEEKQKQFITDASHELKTPLSIILGNAQIIKITEADKENVECLEVIEEQVNRMNSLVLSLVKLSKLEESETKIIKNKFNINNTIEKVIKEFKPLLKGKNIQYEKSEEIYLYNNEESVKQLLTILLDNAIKYTEKNETITVKIESKKSKAKISISNNCQYIDKESLKKLFDRFYRTDKSRNRETGGFGIGLSIAQKTAAIIGSKIYVDYDENVKVITFTTLIS